MPAFFRSVDCGLTGPNLVEFRRLAQQKKFCQLRGSIPFALLGLTFEASRTLAEDLEAKNRVGE